VTEFIPQQPRRKEGHFPNTEGTVLELHRLLSIFLASKKFAELCTNYPGEGHDPIYLIQAVEDDEITRILLTLAITARVIDDRENRVFKRLDSNCGRLQKDVDKPKVAVLDIREACNKIIHAEKIRFDVEEHGDQKYLNPIIYLYGNQQSTHWRAQLDVIKFCKEYVLNVSCF
jgi:hypothetical protein